MSDDVTDSLNVRDFLFFHFYTETFLYGYN
jgi:hypothetical protein